MTFYATPISTVCARCRAMRRGVSAVFLITKDQAYIIMVIEATGFLRVSQVSRLLEKTGGVKSSAYIPGVIRQLRYMQKVYLLPEDLISLPYLSGRPADEDMLAAVDIMLDLTKSKVLAVSTGKPPYKLCFLTDAGADIDSFGVIAAPPGEERKVNFLLEGDSLCQRTVVFLLRDLEQKALFKTSMPHYFAIFDEGTLRYYKP